MVSCLGFCMHPYSFIIPLSCPKFLKIFLKTFSKIEINDVIRIAVIEPSLSPLFSAAILG